MKTKCIIQEMNNVSKFKLRGIMRLDRNRKEMYMLKEENMMRNI